MRQLKHDFFIDSLHIFTLCGFAIAQPLFDLLSRNAEFFIARHSEPIDIVCLTLILIIPFPAIVVLSEAILGIISRTVRKVVHGIMIACLTALIILPVLKKVDILSGTMIVLLAGLVGIGFMLVYIRFRPVRRFVTAISPALLIFPVFFLFNSPVYKIVFPQEVRSIEGAKNNANSIPPIVMVVFDEFPVTSLMDEHRQIDAVRYPNFSALADNAYWFRNATTVFNSTYLSVPVILTGNYPKDNKSLPTAADHPHNLFTLLAGTYYLEVREMITELYPGKRKRRQILVKRATLLLRDLSFIYPHIIIPDEFCENLPDVRQTWKGFGKRVPIRGNATHYAKRMEEFGEFIESITPSTKPTLFFLNILLPHVPWEYYPSGKKYQSGWWDMPGFNKITEKWGNNPWLVTQAYQRHLLQVGATDMLLGKLIDRLKKVGLYDDSLIVITADHGVSFLPGQTRRGVNDKTYQDIIAIPLFIKVPNQHKGIISDRNVETIDILPTIADVIGVRLPWPVDGCSMLDTTLPERSKKILYYGKRKLTYESNLKTKHDTLRRKIALFGSGKSRPGGLFKIGPHNELVGRKVVEFNIVEKKGLALEVDQRDFFTNVDMESVLVPGFITGHVFTNKTGLDTPVNLAVSVNGIIRAVTQTYSSKDGKNRFSFLVSDKAFRKGKNDVEVFIVSTGTNGRLSLHSAKKMSRATYSITGGIITSSDGRKYPLIKDALKGHLSKMKAYEGGLTLSGWIFDVKNNQLPEAVLVFDGDKFIFSGGMNIDRPDVVKVFPDYPLKTGFHFVLPLGLIQDLDNSEVHLFALLKNGEVCELHYASGLKSPICKRSGRGNSLPNGPALPNIYHIIFDEYQTDMFELTLSRDVKENLEDFIYFPENTTLFGRTAMSLASMFSSKSYDLKSSQENYLWNAFNTDASMLHWLKMAGYSTYGYLYPVYAFPFNLFDVTIDYKEHARVAIKGQRAVFSSLWIYANLPYFVAEQLIDSDELDQLKNQNLVSGSANITSLVSFRNFLEEERHLPGTNRYTFIHLLIPHFPCIFNCDCSYNKNLKITSPVEQARCATQLIVDFVKRLKELDRFNDSLILISNAQCFFIMEDV